GVRRAAPGRGGGPGGGARPVLALRLRGHTQRRPPDPPVVQAGTRAVVRGRGAPLAGQPGGGAARAAVRPRRAAGGDRQRSHRGPSRAGGDRVGGSGGRPRRLGGDRRCPPRPVRLGAPRPPQPAHGLRPRAGGAGSGHTFCGRPPGSLLLPRGGLAAAGDRRRSAGSAGEGHRHRPLHRRQPAVPHGRRAPCAPGRPRRGPGMGLAAGQRPTPFGPALLAGQPSDRPPDLARSPAPARRL
ncbi:MAG: N-acetylmannosaminyltransferase, partial [uncultured Acetobacteraceae bacterium]